MNGERPIETAVDLDPGLLESIFLFRSVNIDSIRGIFDFCKVRRLAAGEILFRPGQINWTVYFLLQGTLGIHLNNPDGQPLTILGPGESVGELSVIDRQPTTAYVVAREACLLMIMDEDILWSLVQSSHAVACNLLFTLARRLRHADSVVSGNVCLDKEEYHYGNFDALTGLPNRGWFTELLRRQCARSDRAGKPLSCLLIDIDGFKAFNESYGRQSGNRILYAMAATLNHHLRPTEIIARYGLDQFSILLPDTDIETARGVAVRLFRVISRSTPIMVEGKAVQHPSVSIGVTPLKPGQDADSFLAELEEVITRIKKEGGNSVSE
ncbi:MAG TPA: GGDEF domain-containing protein [Syntrophales bacterium]|nr:GGDEF domain-containing protein [Syntrophales bacterium]HOU78040.1 GGDEF domain-containing protein [Syntrophales bacterium]HPC33033.1 GGDEF domain-containing protein [Syntrophales bacterium]